VLKIVFNLTARGIAGCGSEFFSVYFHFFSDFGGFSADFGGFLRILAVFAVF